ncbi:hypothetical protein XELAEV_18016982mg [Xenopus laevis]|uniref:Uncharacterized protein n=1 Tax=Xenopus laevis TaxID=8355 RepID=A0A974DD13_XENLA|nr:hypothetical protein XELAEV_18016982mg [Xenopus laevis]
MGPHTRLQRSPAPTLPLSASGEGDLHPGGMPAGYGYDPECIKKLLFYGFKCVEYHFAIWQNTLSTEGSGGKKRRCLHTSQWPPLMNKRLLIVQSAVFMGGICRCQKAHCSMAPSKYFNQFYSIYIQYSSFFLMHFISLFFCFVV